MEPRGVRMACHECTWDCVMKSEQDVPDGVRKVVEGVPYCPNCNIAMRPVASVETTDRPKTGISAAMTLEQIAARCVEIEHEATGLCDKVTKAKQVLTEARKAYEAKLVMLRLAVERLGRVMGGEQIQADLPLLALSEEVDDDIAVDGPALWNEPASESVMGAAVRLEAEEIRQQLAAHCIVVDVEAITDWTLEQYDTVVKFLSEVEAAAPDDEIPPLDFLPVEVPDHIGALYNVLVQADVDVILADVCAWTQDQRTAARAWADAPERSERPQFIPGDDPEPARPVPPRRARKHTAVTV